jgi:mono/diheme cytochrome c family protein
MKIIKWFGIALGGLLGAGVLIVFGLFISGNSRITRQYEIQPAAIVVPADAESVERGKRWVDAICIGCHLPDLSGQTMLDAPFGRLNTSNLTSGKGGVGAYYTDADWIRALRHAVDEEGNALLVMPSQDFWYFSDADLGDIIAYLKSLPPVDKELAPPTFNPLGVFLLGAGVFGHEIIPAEIIRHTERPANFPLVAVNAEYGEYLVNTGGCRGCHGAELAGGKSADPAAKTAPNLTPGGPLVVWTDEDFITAIRTGVTPGGYSLDPVQMPWEHYKYYSDDELKAILRYLHSLPKLKTVAP